MACKAGRAMEYGDAMTLQQFTHIGGQFADHIVLSGHHGRQIQTHLAGLDPVVCKVIPGQVVIFTGVQQRLAGNAAHIQAGAAQSISFFHKGCLHAPAPAIQGQGVSAVGHVVQGRHVGVAHHASQLPLGLSQLVAVEVALQDTVTGEFVNGWLEFDAVAGQPPANSAFNRSSYFFG